MKRCYTYIVFFIFLFTISACSIKQQIVGTWKVDTQGDFKNTEYVFQRNGTLELKIPDETIKIHSWEFSKKNKAITISENDNPKIQKFYINYLDPFFLRLANEDSGLFLSRQLKIKSLNYNTTRRKLKGEWSLVQIEDSTFLVGENNLKLIFWDNGIFQERIGEDIRLGQWVLSDDNHTLTISNDDYTQTLGIHFTKKNKLQLVDNYGCYLMEKTTRIRKSPSNSKVEKRIVGAWALQQVGDTPVEKSNYTIYLNEDGSLKTFENQKISTIGQWYVSEDGAFLVLDHSDEQESYPIEFISQKKLSLLDDFQTISFQRVKE